MSKHRLYHLAVDLDSAMVSQCDCVIRGNHSVSQPYRVCGECGERYMTELELIQRCEEMDRDCGINSVGRYLSGNDCYDCPSCTHSF